MKRLIQVGSKVLVVEEPEPEPRPGHLLLRTKFSLISPGTEGARLTLLRQPWRVMEEKSEEIRKFVKVFREDPKLALRAARARLRSPLPLGYSLSGVDADGVLWAACGAERAYHAEVVSVPQGMAVPVPAGVSAEQAAFAGLGSIAFWALKRAGLSGGDRLTVLGLGVLGQLAAALGKAFGAKVQALEKVELRRKVAEGLGVRAYSEPGSLEDEQDIVVVAAADPTGFLSKLGARLLRDGGTLIPLGPSKFAFSWADFYGKELRILAVRSHGPGRYDALYQAGRDYPPSAVPWDLRRNLKAFLDMVREGLVEPAALITHRFPIERGDEAYELIRRTKDFVAVLITYGEPETKKVIFIKKPRKRGLRLAFVGLGNYAKSVLLPELRALGAVPAWAVDPEAGSEALSWGFERATASLDEALEDESLAGVVIASRHSQHAEHLVKALKRGIPAWVEKPLAVSWEQLKAIRDAAEGSAGFVVGHNRRFSPAVKAIREELVGPLAIQIRVNAPPLPRGHWVHLPEEGGQLLGEVSHFVDLARALVGAPIASVRSRRLGESAAFTLTFEDGSEAQVLYFVGGPGSLPKERVEVLGRGDGAVIEDWRTLKIYKGGVRDLRLRGKGQREALKAFVSWLLGGELPVPVSEALEVAWASLEVAGVHGNN